MARTTAILAALNRGEVSKIALARVDVERLRLSAEEQVNWIPRTLGPMTLRPGLGQVGPVRSGATAVHHIPFVYSVTDTALIELTPNKMRVRVGDAIIARPAVTATVTSGDMSSSTGWTITGTGNGGASIGGGELQITGLTIGGYARATNAIAITEQGVQHALRLSVKRGPITLKVGTADNLDDVVSETRLGTGTHSITFTPHVGTVYAQIETSSTRLSYVTGMTVEPAGDMEIATPWGGSDLQNLRYEQSGDVIFVACLGYPIYRIERRTGGSWSLVKYEIDNGPWAAFPAKDVRVAVQGGMGNTTITSTRPLFKPAHVGSLIKAFTPNYTHTFFLGAEMAYTPAIRVTGVGADRLFAYGVSAPTGFVGTWTLERSVTSDEVGFAPVTGGLSGPVSSSSPGSGTFNDGFDNSICWYRIGFKRGNYTSGTISVYFTYTGAGRTGAARILSVPNSTTANIEVLDYFSSGDPTDDWRFGDWSDVVGYPSCIAIHDGRLCTAGRDRFWTSVSDAYASFADTEPSGQTGDASAISRSIGYGPVATINWLVSLSRLIAGAEGSEISIRSSSIDAPLTPTGGLTMKDCSTQGSARVAALKCDTRGIFVQKAGQALYQLMYDVNAQDYQAVNLNRMHPDLNLRNPITRIVIQRQPDTRIHCLRQDGTVAVLLFEPTEEVVGWYRVETAGVVKDIVVLPGAIEDKVHYAVDRGQGIMLERYARLDECRGGALNKLADGHALYEGAATTTVGGLTHLEGKTVVLWGNGKDLGTAVVAGGSVTLPESCTTAVVGLGYDARFKSSKLAYSAQGGTAINQKKRIDAIGLVLADTHAQGVRYGASYSDGDLDDMPLVEDGADVDPDAIWSHYDKAMIDQGSDWDTDPRLCIIASAPRPATVMAATVTVTTSG